MSWIAMIWSKPVRVAARQRDGGFGGNGIAAWPHACRWTTMSFAQSFHIGKKNHSIPWRAPVFCSGP